MIYLDHAATAFPRHPGVGEAMAAALEIAGSVGRGSHDARALDDHRRAHRRRIR